VSADDFIRATHAAQGALAASGLRAGDRLLLVLRDTLRFPALFLGALRGGFIPIPVSTLLPAKDVRFIAQDAEVRAAVVDRELPDELADPRLFPPNCALFRGDEACWREAAAPSAAATPAGAEAFWLYTSGTTGRPKGVIHRHADLIVTAEQYGRGVLEIGGEDRLLSAAKLFFAYGLGNALTFPLWLGAETILYADRPTPEAMFELIERHRPTIFFGVPTLYAAMLACDVPPGALASLRICASAGEALPAPIFETFRERFGVEILDGIGSTEMLHIFLSNRAGSVRPGTSGSPVPGYVVRVVDEEMRDVAPGESGELLAYGESAARSYHNRAEATAHTMFEPGWLRTGDRYIAHEDGTFQHTGRQNDLFKVSGQWVSPVEVESTLIEHPAVLEAAVVGAEDERELMKPKAFVVLTGAASPSAELEAELREHVKARLTPHKYPRWFVFVDALPKTATGKIQRFNLRAKA
jgi:benzoate-CoA ligase family protein